MEGEKRIADYFIVAGSNKDHQVLLAETSAYNEEGLKKNVFSQEPITDLAVIFTSLGEQPPDGYTCIELTPKGFPANLNHGSIKCPEVYLCYRRGTDKPPLADLGVMYEGKDALRRDSEVLQATPYGRPANINNASARTLITFRRGRSKYPCNEMVVSDVCVIFPSKGEKPPHSFYRIDKNLNRAMVGTDVYLCYKKSVYRPPRITYKPVVLDRLPMKDHADFPFPSGAEGFCLPLGATLEAWPPPSNSTNLLQRSPPVFSTFILTVSDAKDKLYGAAVSFYELCAEEELSEEQRKLLEQEEQNDEKNHGRIYRLKSLCLLSHWPFFDAFEKFLLFLYKMADGSPQPLPLERVIGHLLHEVPFPSPSRPTILVQLSPDDGFFLSLPHSSPLPHSGASFRELILNLDVDNVLLILLLTMLEHKIVLHSLRPDVLTSIAEAVCMMIFPFHWQCPYIPMCPLGLSDLMGAPLPFLLGLDSRFFDLYDPPEDVICIDLDTDSLRIPEDKQWMTTKLLPRKAAKTLRGTLKSLQPLVKLLAEEELAHSRSMPPAIAALSANPDATLSWKRKQQVLETSIQEAFLRFTASILKGYHNYLLPITKAPSTRATDAAYLFDLQAFLRSREKTHHTFYAHLMKTQMFIRFIEERSFVSSKDSSLVFFDDIMEKMSGDLDVDHGGQRLLELDSPHSDCFVFLPPPDSQGLPPDSSFLYPEFRLRNIEFYPVGVSEQNGEGVRRCMHLPPSPLIQRTKHELRLAQKQARKCAEVPMLWAKYLLSSAFSLWFLQLPAYVEASESPGSALMDAFQLLLRVHSLGLKMLDEVCYRVVVQLCGVHSLPLLAMRVLTEMRKTGLTPNAITYGYYNKVIVESNWQTSKSQIQWRKLRNVIMAMSAFHSHVKVGQRRPSNSSDEVGLDQVDRDARASPESGANPSTCTDKISTGPSISIAGTSQSDGGYASLPDSSVPGVIDSKEVKVESSVRVRRSLHGLTDDGDDLGVSRLPPDPQEGNDSKGKIGKNNQSEAFYTGGRKGKKERHMSESGNRPRLSKAKRRFSSADDPTPSSPISEKERIRKSPVPRSASCKQERSDKNQSLERSLKGSEEDRDMLMLPSVANGPLTPCSTLGPRSPARTPVTENDPLGALGGTSFSLPPSIPMTPSSSSSLMTPPRHVSLTSLGSTHSLPEEASASRFSPFPSSCRQERSDKNQSLERSLKGSEEDRDMLMLPSVANGPLTPCSTLGPRSPARTPVTENDPLGALGGTSFSLPPSIPMTPSSSSSLMTPPRHVSLTSLGSTHSLPEEASASRFSPFPSRFSHLGAHLRRSIRLGGASPGHGGKLPLSSDPQAVHRSSTHPEPLGGESSASPHTSGNTKFSSGIASLTAGLKSLGSPSTVERNSQGTNGHNLSARWKLATSSLSKTFDSIREAISSSPSSIGTPPALTHRRSHEEEGGSALGSTDSLAGRSDTGSDWTFPDGLLDSLWGRQNADRQSQNSLNTQQPSAYEMASWDPFSGEKSSCIPGAEEGPMAMDLRLCTCSQCHACGALLYDEDLLAKWTPEDSNLNSICMYCDHKQAPHLTVIVRDYRNLPRPPDRETQEEEQSLAGEPLESRHVVPYLSPLVLRKELENVLENEGHSIVLKPTFLDKHPILYWNLVWYFHRLCVPSQFLVSASLNASSLHDPPTTPDTFPHKSWEDVSNPPVAVFCLWDNPLLLGHEPPYVPLYRSLSKEVLASVTCNDVKSPIKLLLQDYRKHKEGKMPYSLYREILFLSFVALGRHNIDH
ncbi:unnamed protein product, partial [Darwinula stevensoni]